MSDSGSDDEFMIQHRIKGSTKKCPHCKKVLSSKSMRRHIRSVHQNAKAIKCDECSEVFNQQSSLHLHKQSKHESQPNAPEFECSKCKISFESFTSYDEHRRAMHDASSKTRTFQCTKCSYKTKFNSKIQYHMNKRHSSEPVKPADNASPPEEPALCTVCHKTFTRKSDLKRHFLHIHQGIRPFICKTCGEGFTQAGNLRCHMLTRHQVTTLDLNEYRAPIPSVKDINFTTVYQCADCEHVLPTMDSLLQHHSEAHPELEEAIA